MNEPTGPPLPITPHVFEPAGSGCAHCPLPEINRVHVESPQTPERTAYEARRLGERIEEATT